MSKLWFSLALLITVPAFLSACANGGSEPLGPDEIAFTTSGYSFKHQFQRAKLEENWPQLKVGMTVKEVVDLLGIPIAGTLMVEAIAASEMYDLDYGGSLLKFRQGTLREYLQSGGLGTDYDRTLRMKRERACALYAYC